MILEKLDRRVNLKNIQVVFLLEIGNRQESQVTSGAWWGLGGLSEGERVREKGAGEEWGMLGGLGVGEEGRIDMGSGKNISQLRESVYGLLET